MKKLIVLLCLLLTLCTVASADTLTISMVGDCTVGEQYCYRGYQSGFCYKISQRGLDYPFSLAADLFAADDLTLANCEGAFTTRYPGKNAKAMTLGASPDFAQVFVLGNVDVCNTANNHGRDFGAKGLEDTHATLNALGITTFGEDVTAIREVKGVKIGFVGYTYPITDQKLNWYKKAIEQLRADGATFVIASAHWGKEESHAINLQQRTYAPKLIDAGADMVYGHGAHVLQPIQIYKGKLIFYGLANFTFGANSAPKDDDTVVVQVTFDIQEDGTLTPAELNAIPYKMHMKKDFRPWPLEDQEAKEKVWKKLVFTKKRDPDSGLPDSFLTTGYADLRAILQEEPAQE